MNGIDFYTFAKFFPLKAFGLEYYYTYIRRKMLNNILYRLVGK